MRRLWLTFAQTITIILAIFFVVSTLRPELLPWSPSNTLITIKEATPTGTVRSDSFHSAAKKAMPSVVNIFTNQEIKQQAHPLLEDPKLQEFFGDPPESKKRRTSNLGSGVIVSPKGYILTNHHVVATADEVEVALIDGRKTKARVIGTDPGTDLAVLKINLKDLTAITFGQSSDVMVGDIVLAVGNPFGVGQTVTMGIVGALGRSQVGINTFENFIQTDAAINPGNSGGALTDTSGNLIGINTAIFSRSGGSLGVGFAVPVDVAKQIMAQIIESGSVTRGWLGITMQDITEELAESFDLEEASGVLVPGVLKDGPADLAGIKPGDILIAIAGKPMAHSSDVLNLVAELPPGDKVTITILRDNKEKNVEILVGTRPQQIQRN
ncbi:MAG: Do family serine endopeptidase [Nitrosomonas sp.]|nr:Do family serine endopeptidase [Nitrosomonas sp.]